MSDIKSCGACGQILLYQIEQRKHVCINSMCPGYFEPALRIPGTGDNDRVQIHPTTVLPPSEPERGHGIKLDTGKPLIYSEFIQQFPLTMRLIALIGDAGSKAPGHVRGGWKSVDRGFERYSEAMLRHMGKEIELNTGPEPDSPDPMRDLIWQVGTVTWNSLARTELLLRENQSAAERLDTTREV